jgi:hypothetical protein
MPHLPTGCRWVVLAAMLVHGALAGANPCTSLEPARWLVGSWLAPGESRVVHETWRASSEATFEGESMSRSRTDDRLLESESLRLVAMAGEVFYVAKVSHNQFPVAFRLVTCDADRLVFENPAHDFPRRIEYRRTAADAFEAHVSDGAAKGFRLLFSRSPAG